MLLVAFVISACSSDDRSTAPDSEAVEGVSAQAGDEFSAAFSDVVGITIEFVLKSGESPIYTLKPGIGTSEPSSSPIDGNEVFFTGGIRVEPGDALTFRLPADVTVGSYSLCSSLDECIRVDVTEPS